MVITCHNDRLYSNVLNYTVFTSIHLLNTTRLVIESKHIFVLPNLHVTWPYMVMVIDQKILL